MPDPNLALVKAPKLDVLRPNVNPELRSQLITNFLETYSPGRPYLQDGTGRNLLQTLPDITGDSVILEKAGICLAAGFLASQNQDDRLLQYSSKLYGNTLRTLHGKITSGAKLSQDMLYTTVLLQIYEVRRNSDLPMGSCLTHVSVDQLFPTRLWGMDSPRSRWRRNFHPNLCPGGRFYRREALSSSTEIRDSQCSIPMNHSS